MKHKCRFKVEAAFDLAEFSRMLWPPDYHMHTPLCRHAQGAPTAYAAHALQAGLTEIGFSDHAPMPMDDFDDWRMRLDQLDAYAESVEAARREFPQLRIRLALEVDYLPEFEDWARELRQRHDWDYLIGSVHYLEGNWPLDDPRRLEEWRQRDPDALWASYFERLTRAAASGLFDIIGHADLCKKFGFYPKSDPAPLFDAFILAAKKSGAAMEINTAGLRKPCRELYPAPPLLERAAAHGIPLTFGSDAHAPAEVGADFPLALEAAHRAGFTCYSRFSRGRREEAPLPLPPPAKGAASQVRTLS